MSTFLQGESENQSSSRALSGRFSSQVLLTMGTNLALALLALVTGSLIARYLGPEGRGELAAIQTWSGFIALLAVLGLPDAVVFFTSRFPGQGREYLVSAISILLLISIPFIIAGYILLPELLSAQPESIIQPARWYLTIFILLQVTQGMLLHPLRGRNDFIAWNLFRVAYMLGWLAVVLLVGLAGHKSVIYVASGYLISLFIMAIPVGSYVLMSVPGDLEVNTKLLRPMLSYGLPLMASVVPQTLNLRMDQLAMGMYLPPQELGYYAIAVTWSGIALPIVNGIGAVLFPWIASITAITDRNRILTSASSFSLFLTAAISLSAMLITPVVIPLLFGQSYIPAIPATIILLAASIPLSFSFTLEEGMRGLGNSKAVLWAEGAGLIITISALGILLFKYGIIGAAISSLLGYNTTAVVLLVMLHQITGEPISSYLNPHLILWTRIMKNNFSGLINRHTSEDV